MEKRRIRDVQVPVRMKYTRNACIRCKVAKVRCDGDGFQSCSRCVKTGLQCRYTDKPTSEDVIVLKNILNDLGHLDLSGQGIRTQPIPFSTLTGVYDLHIAWSERHRLKVAVKRARDDKSFEILKQTGKEIRVWSELQDENVLVLLGYYNEGDSPVPSLVSQWMEKGRLDSYIKRLPRGGEETCVLLSDVASGVAYLHSRDIIHGDLRASNILVSGECVAKISNFALSRKESPIALPHFEGSPRSSHRWMAPELVSSFTAMTTKATDMWAFGMIGHELLSWCIPYSTLGDITALSAIADGKPPDRPEKPEISENAMIFNMLWTICNFCWKDPHLRMAATDISSLLQPHSVNRSKLIASASSPESIEMDEITSTREPSGNTRHPVKELLEPLSYLDLEGSILPMKQRESKIGGYSDVYSAWSKRHNIKVAVKQVRNILRKDVSFIKKFVNEIRIWAKLEHENVLPLKGFYFEGEELMPNLVSEWMEDGTLDEYIVDIPPCSVEILELLRGITAGLAYLHSNKIIHGDLKGPNILISSRKTPLLADFGLSRALQKTLTIMATTSTSSNAACRGSLRWMAPELLIVVDGESPSLNEMTDVWALGMVAYELLSGNVPYANVKNDFAVIPVIQKKITPSKPTEMGDLVIFEKIWSFCCSCWNFDCASRPSSEQATQLWSS
ncbi:kinase-like protein [Schizopora paradoxa]|uniref:Kinase-like protein n=1 Tax=Schizopora paradoxa TaxID=27342 RepID=A0A0H2RG66_9AGAM|nr:kinase-like protein [Schizopora paradoxa]